MNDVVKSAILFTLAMLAIGFASAWLSPPGEWYAALSKPSFNPPNWIFGPVWTTLYVLIAIAGWRVWHIAGASTARAFWWAQLGLNFLWSPVFFAAHMIGTALVVIVLLAAAIVGFIVASRRVDGLSALLFLPYLAWVAFATALNTALWLLN